MINRLIKAVQVILEYLSYIFVFLTMMGAVCLVAKAITWSSLVTVGLNIDKHYWYICAALCMLGILSIILGGKNGK